MSSHPLSSVPLSSWGEWPEVMAPGGAVFEVHAEMDIGIVNPAVQMLSHPNSGYIYAVEFRPRIVGNKVST